MNKIVLSLSALVCVGLAAVSAAVGAPTGGPCGKPPAARPGISHVLTIVFENHSFAEVAHSSPYLNRLAAECGLATDYSAITHPSLPNYLALTSGGTDGIHSDCTDCSAAVPSIFSQLRGDWRTYAEGLPAAGFGGGGANDYAKKHNPAAYYPGVRKAFGRADLPLGSVEDGPLARALRTGKLARYSLVIPDLCNDEHDCPLGVGDRWASRWLPAILRSRAYRTGTLAVFVTYDEGTDSDNRVYTVVVSPFTPAGDRVATPFDHYSLLRTTESLLGVPCLASACTARSMSRAFGL